MILPAGFALVRGWAPARNLGELVNSIRFEQPTVRVYGKEHKTPRLVSWMGDAPYTYAGHRHEPAELPAWLRALKCAIEIKTGARFNSVLANYYRDGSDTVAYHADDEPELGAEPTIASLSLGGTRTFSIKRRAGFAKYLGSESWTFPLHNGDLLVMSGASQRDYVHALPRTKRPVGPRLNLTFRKM